MKIQIDLLKNHAETIPLLIKIWHEGIARIWLPDVCIDRVENKLTSHLNSDKLPLTYVAFDGDRPVGMCSLRDNDGIRPDLTPWLGSLVVDPEYQGRGIAQLLMNAVKAKAQALGFNKCFLFTFDSNLAPYYTRQGWTKIAMNEFMDKPVTVMETEL